MLFFSSFFSNTKNKKKKREMPLRSVDTVIEQVLEAFVASILKDMMDEVSGIDGSGGRADVRRVKATLAKALSTFKASVRHLAWLYANLPRLVVYGGDWTPNDLCVELETLGGLDVATSALPLLPRARQKVDGWPHRQFYASFGFEPRHFDPLAAYLLSKITGNDGKVRIHHVGAKTPREVMMATVLRLRGNQWKFVAAVMGIEECDATTIGMAGMRCLAEIGQRATDLAHNYTWAVNRIKGYTEEYIAFRTNHNVPVWGTLDGTTMHTSRIHKGVVAERTGQATWSKTHMGYNGHHKRSELTWLSVTTPDGMTAHVTTPALGGTNDITLQKMRDSRGLEDLHVWVANDDTPSHISREEPPSANRRYTRAEVYADQGLDGNSDAVLISNSVIYTGWIQKREKRLRVPSEWDNRDVKYFHLLEACAGRNRVLNLSGVEQNYASDPIFAAYLLKNIRTILYGNETAKFFGCEPPKLAEYLTFLVRTHGAVPDLQQ